MKSIVRLVAALAAGFLLAAAVPAGAQVQLIIPWPPGGGTDIIGRLIQPVFAEELGAQLVIRNVGGATGTIGTAEVVRSKPDGTTLLLTSMAAVVIQPSFRANAPYTVDQLTPVCQVAEAPAVLMTPKNSGIRSVADIARKARETPGQIAGADAVRVGWGGRARPPGDDGSYPCARHRVEPCPFPRLGRQRARDAARHRLAARGRGELGAAVRPAPGGHL